MEQSNDQHTPFFGGLSVPVMTREAWATAIGLPVGVVIAQCDRGLWPTLKVGKRVFLNVEAVRVLAGQKAEGFVL